MALYVNTNVSSLNAQRQLMNSGNSLDTAFQRLSSGSRINSAKDDAAGLQISSRLSAQINGLNQGNRNANDGISLAQTAEGAMDEVTGMLQRIRTLAQQAANGSNTDEDRLSLQQEVVALGKEIDRIATDTTFGGTKLMNGSYDGIFQVGADASQTISFSMKGITSVNGSGEQAITNFRISSLAAAMSGIVTDGSLAATAFATATGLSVSTADKAQSMLAGVDKMIAGIDKKRAELGAVQNRFSSTIRNQANIAENVAAARSRIQDADFAAETASLTKFQILQQASSTILSQANQRPQGALSLLQG